MGSSFAIQKVLKTVNAQRENNNNNSSAKKKASPDPGVKKVSVKSKLPNKVTNASSPLLAT